MTFSQRNYKLKRNRPLHSFKLVRLSSFRTQSYCRKRDETCFYPLLMNNCFVKVWQLKENLKFEIKIIYMYIFRTWNVITEHCYMDRDICILSITHHGTVSCLESASFTHHLRFRTSTSTCNDLRSVFSTSLNQSFICPLQRHQPATTSGTHRTEVVTDHKVLITPNDHW